MNTTKILKYPIHGGGVLNSIKCRRRRFLDIQLQGDNSLVCWVETNDDLREVEIKLIGVGTGWSLDSDVMANTFYIKTVQDADGYVWHFYEIFESNFDDSE